MVALWWRGYSRVEPWCTRQAAYLISTFFAITLA